MAREDHEEVVIEAAEEAQDAEATEEATEEAQEEAVPEEAQEEVLEAHQPVSELPSDHILQQQDYHHFQMI